MNEVTSLSPLLQESDKSFWHGYMAFYDRVLPPKMSASIVEFGVFHGHSIRWLLSKYPKSRIHGVDILPTQPEWPVSDRVDYHRVDQSSESAVAEFFQTITAPSLIIEDGSHIPSHQARCLRLGMQHLSAGGFYVLEDIHTSHPTHELYTEEFATRTKPQRLAQPHPTVLSLLLCFEHLQRTGQSIDEVPWQQFAQPGFMSVQDLQAVFRKIKRIELFKRATLPTRCYACNSTQFNYIDFRCKCGVDLMKVADSMTVLIEAN